MLFEEFIANEIDAGNISADSFKTDARDLIVHGHCHQKALAGTASLVKTLSLPANYKVVEVKSVITSYSIHYTKLYEAGCHTLRAVF